MRYCHPLLLILAAVCAGCSANHGETSSAGPGVAAASSVMPFDPMANPLPGMPPRARSARHLCRRPAERNSAPGQALSVAGLRAEQRRQHESTSSIRRRSRSSGIFGVGRQPQHVVPSCGLQVAVGAERPGRQPHLHRSRHRRKRANHPVDDPYNMYYTPDGKYAIVVAERQAPLDFHDPKTMKPGSSRRGPLPRHRPHGLLRDGRSLIASCEFSADSSKWTWPAGR